LLNASEQFVSYIMARAHFLNTFGWNDDDDYVSFVL